MNMIKQSQYSKKTRPLASITSVALWQRMFENRKQTLMKKARELEKACGVVVTVTIHSHNNPTYYYSTNKKIKELLLTSGIVNGRAVDSATTLSDISSISEIANFHDSFSEQISNSDSNLTSKEKENSQSIPGQDKNFNSNSTTPKSTPPNQPHTISAKKTSALNSSRQSKVVLNEKSKTPTVPQLVVMPTVKRKPPDINLVVPEIDVKKRKISENIPNKPSVTPSKSTLPKNLPGLQQTRKPVTPTPVTNSSRVTTPKTLPLSSSESSSDSSSSSDNESDSSSISSDTSDSDLSDSDSSSTSCGSVKSSNTTVSSPIVSSAHNKPLDSTVTPQAQVNPASVSSVPHVPGIKTQEPGNTRNRKKSTAQQLSFSWPPEEVECQQNRRGPTVESNRGSPNLKSKSPNRFDLKQIIELETNNPSHATRTRSPLKSTSSKSGPSSSQPPHKPLCRSLDKTNNVKYKESLATTKLSTDNTNYVIIEDIVTKVVEPKPFVIRPEVRICHDSDSDFLRSSPKTRKNKNTSRNFLKTNLPDQHPEKKGKSDQDSFLLRNNSQPNGSKLQNPNLNMKVKDQGAETNIPDVNDKIMNKNVNKLDLKEKTPTLNVSLPDVTRKAAFEEIDTKPVLCVPEAVKQEPVPVNDFGFTSKFITTTNCDVSKKENKNMNSVASRSLSSCTRETKVKVGDVVTPDIASADTCRNKGLKTTPLKADNNAKQVLNKKSDRRKSPKNIISNAKLKQKNKNAKLKLKNAKVQQKNSCKKKLSKAEKITKNSKQNSTSKPASELSLLSEECRKVFEIALSPRCLSSKPGLLRVVEEMERSQGWIDAYSLLRKQSFFYNMKNSLFKSIISVQDRHDFLTKSLQGSNHVRVLTDVHCGNRPVLLRKNFFNKMKMNRNGDIHPIRSRK